MVNCVMRRDDRWRVRPARCAQCCAVVPDQIQTLRSKTTPAAPARGADIQRRRAATTSGDKREPENCFTALFQSAETRNSRSRSHTTSARLIGMNHRGATSVSATASTSVSSQETEGEMTLFDNKPLPRKLRRPTVSSTKSSPNERQLRSPVGLDLDQVDLGPQTRPRRHTTSTLPTFHSADTTDAQHEAREPTPAPKQQPRRRVERANSQPYPQSSALVDLSYLSDYK